MKKAKSFEISKSVVVEAWKRVKANQGAAGVDKESITDFERDLKGNLYKIWNRMSSGSYVPPPVRTVAIPKKTFLVLIQLAYYDQEFEKVDKQRGQSVSYPDWKLFTQI